MKRIYTYLIVAAGLMMSSCQEYHIDSQPELPPTIRIDALDEYSVTAISPSRIVFNISANTPWYIESDSQWCIPSPGMSAASSLVSEIVIIPENNDSTFARTATLTVTADNSGIAKTITVIQAGKTDEPAIVIDEPEESETDFDLTFAEGTEHMIIPSTGYLKVYFRMGEMFRTNYTIKKGRTIIEIDDLKMSSICNLGFNFTAESSANYKLHMESDNTYWFRCAGGFSWVAPIKKTYTLEEVNAIRKLEFVVEDDTATPGTLKISIYINDKLYGSQVGRTDIFATGDPGCHFIFETGVEPTAGDYCVFKSITYISE